MVFAAVSLTALLLATSVAGVCYNETAVMHCYNGEWDIPQEVNAADVSYVAAYLRAYGRETRNGRHKCFSEYEECSGS